MRYKLLMLALTGTLVPLLASCSTSRTATSEVSWFKVQDSRARDSVVVQSIEVHDTLREVTTITIDRNDRGDTLRQSIVTDRERVRNAADVRSKRVDVRVVRDTVYVAVRDSVLVERHQPSAISHQTSSSLIHLLKWVFWILVAVIVLVIILKVKREM